MVQQKNIQQDKYQYSGGIHIHSEFSDGSGNLESISKAAKEAGLDWIIVTDHNTLQFQEGFMNGVCVIKGEEISPYNENHYLALGINDYVSPDTNMNKTIQEVRNKGGFGFAAHPDESQTRKNKHFPIRWKDKSVVPDGVEIWNWFSQWADNLNEGNILGLIYAFCFKHRLINKPNIETLAWWDKLNNNSKGIIPAIGGLDVHALKINKYILPVTVFPYKNSFRTITNVISLNSPLSDNFDECKAVILNALKNGNNIIVNRNISKEVPEISIKNMTTKVSYGESINLDENTTLSVRTKKIGRIKVLFNGKEIKNILAKQFKMLLSEIGKYRVEIEIKGKGFAYSNPISVQ